MNLIPIPLDTGDRPPFERIEVASDNGGSPCPEPFRNRLMVDVIHDGHCIPQHLLNDERGRPLVPAGELHRHYCVERDWGAELVGSCLAGALHLGAYYRVNIARALVDFGRFPGITPGSADHMTRFAINSPFAQRLSFEQKRALLESCYDRISAGMDQVLPDKLIKLSIHSYDVTGANDARRRPEVSIVTRSFGHQRGFDDPIELFDPLVPHELAETTADPLLRARIALALEEAAIQTADNYPYALPEGSVEVRSQVWYFFNHVRRLYEKAHPQRSPARALVWDMLMDTNLRSSQSEALRSYLHMFRRPPRDQEALFHRARDEYEQIGEFIRADDQALLRRYSNALDRPSSILLEVRKDLVWEFRDGEPVGPRRDNTRLIARTIACALSTYLVMDRAAKAEAMRKKGLELGAAPSAQGCRRP